MLNPDGTLHCLKTVQVAAEIWPVEDASKDGEDSEGEAELSIEDQIKKEMSEMKKPRAEQRFGTSSLGLSSIALKEMQPTVKRIRLVVGLVRI